MQLRLQGGVSRRACEEGCRVKQPRPWAAMMDVGFYSNSEEHEHSGKLSAMYTPFCKPTLNVYRRAGRSAD